MSRAPETGLVRRVLAGGTVERTMGDGTVAKAVIASTDDPDRYDDIVDQATWKLDNFRKNPVMPCDHDYDVHKLVCSGDVEVVGGKLTIVPTVWAEDDYAQMVKGKYDAGILRAVSVGFIPGRAIPRSQLPKEDTRYSDKWGYVYYDCELLEVSWVVVPANPAALAMKSFDVDSLVSRITDEVMRRLTPPVVEQSAPDKPTDSLSWLRTT